MTTSKSDLEAKEGQPPNESNFLEFVSLLGSLSSRTGGSSVQEEEAECKEKNEVQSKQAGWFLYCSFTSLETIIDITRLMEVDVFIFCKLSRCWI